MESLSQKQLSSATQLASLIANRIGEHVRFVNKIDEDPETGSSLCELEFNSKKATVWVRRNGGVRLPDGTIMLCAEGRRPRKNRPLPKFTDI